MIIDHNSDWDEIATDIAKLGLSYFVNLQCSVLEYYKRLSKTYFSSEKLFLELYNKARMEWIIIDRNLVPEKFFTHRKFRWSKGIHYDKILGIFFAYGKYYKNIEFLNEDDDICIKYFSVS